ncbi:uncharacterized protein LOC108665354 [Hyalella azteca]|uniref:Uncharacterized protein LOC108665354 n=1 Tax=Hyalella azteca TaxID=294128 RepID=A0A8B7N176_HYAAZ|nr:uncharacterized protein LOC108665354 [Hyalella azteca]
MREPWLLCLFLMLFLHDARPQPAVTGMRWCRDFCLCPHDSDTMLKCLEDDDIYRLIDLNERHVARLTRAGWSPTLNLGWCGDNNCLCNKESGKHFGCGKLMNVLTNFIDQASEVLALFEREREVGEAVVSAGVGLYTPPVEAHDGESDNINIAVVEDGPHSKRDMDDEERRNRRRERKHRRNRKRNRIGGEEDIGGPVDESEYFAPPSSEDDYPETNSLPKQEAINSNPMVTAMQPPHRRHPAVPAVTESSFFDNHADVERYQPPMESVHPGSSAIESHTEILREKPLEMNSVAGKVSEDLETLTEDVAHIRSDVIFNQRILLVTVGVAGVAMLGVVVLALHACCARRSRRAHFTENGRPDDLHHHPSSTVTKVNINEAW